MFVWSPAFIKQGDFLGSSVLIALLFVFNTLSSLRSLGSWFTKIAAADSNNITEQTRNKMS